MPDGDIYDRSIDKWWRAAAHRVYELDNGPRAVEGLLWSLRKTVISLGGCPGIDSIAEAILDLCQQPITAARRFQIADQLESIRRAHINSRTDRIVDTGRYIVANSEQIIPLDFIDDRSVAMNSIVKYMLVDLAMGMISPAGFLEELQVRKGIPLRITSARRKRVREQLLASQELAPLAEQLLDNPRGGQFHLPKIKTQKESQAQILASPAA